MEGKKNKFIGKYKSLGDPIYISPLSSKTISVLTFKKDKDEITKDIKLREEERENFVATERLKKLSLLLDYYGIDKNKENAWFELTYKLSVDYFLGFQLKELNNSGRKEEWNDFKLLKLYFEVNKKIAEKKSKDLSYSQRSICNSLSQEWGSSGATLNNRYIKAKKSQLVKWASQIMNDDQLEQFLKLTKGAKIPKQ